MKTFPKPLTAAEEKKCLELVKAGDQAAKDTLIERNMRLVAHVVKKYQGTDYDMDDLLSVGTIGLIKAVNTFKTDRGSRLATYAVKCVENAILSLRLLQSRKSLQFYKKLIFAAGGFYPNGSPVAFYYTFRDGKSQTITFSPGSRHIRAVEPVKNDFSLVFRNFLPGVADRQTDFSFGGSLELDGNLSAGGRILFCVVQ